MKTVIMQPSYLPYLGFFDLMKRCNLFIIYDDVKYTKNDWRNRNKIKTPSGCQWLTVPVSSQSVNQKINMVEPESVFWPMNHLKSIHMNYAQARNYKSVYEEFKEVMDEVSQRGKLIYICMGFIEWIKNYLGIKCDIKYSSSIGFADYSKTDRLVLLCNAVGASEYISPNGAMDYLDADKFDEAGIKLTWQNYTHPVYEQLWGDFVSHLSIIDLMFNCGKKSGEIV